MAAAHHVGAEPLAFDLHGQARNIDLRHMPRDLKIPPAATDVNADYHIVGSVATGAAAPHGAGGPPATELKADAHFLLSTVAGAKIADGSTAGFQMHGQEIAYSADATVAELDLQRVGEQFGVPALATDRYRSAISAHITANGRGATPQEMDVTAHGTVTDASLLGGRIPQLAFDASLAHDTAHVKANGSFADFDPAASMR
jgi:hypothetical protein